MPVDWTNPLARDLVFATYATDSKAFVDMVTGRVTNDPFAPDFSFKNVSYTKAGRGRSTNGGSYRNTFTTRPTAPGGAGVRGGQQTTLVICRPRLVPSTAYSVAWAGSIDGWFMGKISFTTDGYIDAGVTNGPSLKSDLPFTLNEIYTIVAVNDVPGNASLADNAGQNASNGQWFFLNGVKQQATSNYTGMRGKTMDQVGIGTFTSNMVDVLAVFVWERALDPEEARAVTNNPYQVFSTRAGIWLPRSVQQALVQRRGLARIGSDSLVELSAGSGRKPLVLVNGEIRERTASEGPPIVLVNGQLRTLGAGETLVY
jgi:hypothetical protein